MKINLKDSDSLKKMIMINGHSLRSFAKRIGISSPYMVQIANMDRNPGPQIAKKISAELDVEFEEIFFIKDVHKSVQDEKNKTA